MSAEFDRQPPVHEISGIQDCWTVSYEVSKDSAKSRPRLLPIVLNLTGNEKEIIYRNYSPETLHVCSNPRCCAELVYPIQWEQMSDERWRITTRCPNCELFLDLIAEHGHAEAYDDVLNRGTETVIRTHKELDQHNFAESARFIIEALKNDNIVPMDF